MTDLEAIESLQERARRFARGFHVSSGVATVGAAVAFTGLLIVLQWAVVDVASIKLAAIGGVGLAVATVPLAFRFALRAALSRKRPEWIEELVRTEGAKRDVLEASFTLDSW